MLIQKKLYFVVIFLLIMLSGCETYRANVEADAIIGNQLEILDSYKGSPYVKGYDSKPSQPYQNNAMTTAIIYRNLDAVKKLVSFGANRSTSIDYYYSGDPSAEFSYFDPRFIRSMSVPAVDLACIVFDLEIVDYSVLLLLLRTILQPHLSHSFSHFRILTYSRPERKNSSRFRGLPCPRMMCNSVVQTGQRLRLCMVRRLHLSVG